MRQIKIQSTPTYRETKAFDIYLSEVARSPILEPDEELELIREVRKGGENAEKAKNKLVYCNLRFVISVAKQYQCKGLSLVDLINEGNIGLLTAIDRYDETRGFKFISYAVWWIRQSILIAITNYSRIIRLPQNQVTAVSKIHRLSKEFEQKNLHEPSISELSQLSNLSEDYIYQLIVADKHHLSVDLPVSNDFEETLGDTLCSDETVEDNLNKESLRYELDAVLNELLEPREIKMIKEYFFDGKNYTEIAYELKLSRERVRQLINKSILRIRDSRAGIEILRKYIK